MVPLSAVINRTFPIRSVVYRFLATQSTQLDNQLKHKMCGWQIHSYNDNLDDIQYSDNIRIPTIRSTNEVLINVDASSVNPIDILISRGYGATVFNLIRCNNNNIEFPLSLGRDFVGTVTRTGMGVDKNIQIGDKVWGTATPHQNGTHVEYVNVNEQFILHKPKILDDLQLAALPYAGITAWSALFITGELGGGLCPIPSTKQKRVCILGASGGVGHIAIQIAKAENAHVVATCSTDAVGFVQECGADCIIDYKEESADSQLIKNGPYDIILDCAGKGPYYANQLPWDFKNYVTLASPFLRNVDSGGLINGMAKNLMDLISPNVTALSRTQGLVKWAFYVPSQIGLAYLRKLVEEGNLIPHIHESFNFQDANVAYQRLSDGHVRGKIVIDFKSH